ncbi:gamma-glutamylcyclotransferase [Trinickia symbiotica]|uniref:Gamma-glutamylcyclotransferase n=1 Tax=Trinickia symbiotica TaxID=863227 RepID=A0A2T3XTZ0_9BURK|nr:gamma-glutamylcyclotransferase family protein [Trinickia symbiotica]PTB19912.1 gamma-glutamylcyclotransferase [Trinickia symbiotica]
MRYVFVYGTLRAGEINDIERAAARHGIEAPRLVGTAAIRGRLYDFGAYPGLVLDAAAGPVRGDVYEIDDALVPVLDEIEEVYPGVDGLFKSREVTVAADGRNVTCLYYRVDAESVAGLPRIAIGDWVEYRLARDAEPALG